MSKTRNKRNRSGRSKRGAEGGDLKRAAAVGSSETPPERGKIFAELAPAPTRILPAPAVRFLESRPRTAAIVLAAAYVLVMSVLSFKYHIMGGYGVETDFYIFVTRARQIFEGEFPIDGARGPIYFVILAVIGRMAGDFFRGGMIIGLLSAGCLLYFINRLVGMLLRRDIALAVTVLTALNPTFVQHTYSSGTDMVFAALASGAIYFSLRYWPMGVKRLVWSGILCALVYLTRFNGVFILGGLALGLLLDTRHNRVGARIASAALLCLVFLAAISPWGFYCLSKKGDFFYNTNYQNVAYTVFAEGEVGWDEFWLHRSSEFESFGDVIAAAPGEVAAKLAKNIYVHLKKDMDTLLGWHLGVPALIGLASTLARRPSGRWRVYLVINLLCFCILLVVFYNPRFSLFLVPAYVLLAVLGIEAALGPARNFLTKMSGHGRRTRNTAVVPIVLALAALTIWTFVQSYRFNKDVIVTGPGEILSLARWYKSKVPVSERGGLIVARKPHIAYYLELDFDWMPDADSPQELLGKIKEMGADYLYFSYMEASRRPNLSGLLDPSAPPPGLRHLAHTKQPPAVLYAVE